MHWLSLFCLVKSYSLSKKTPLKTNFRQQVMSYNGIIKKQTFSKQKVLFFNKPLSPQVKKSRDKCNLPPAPWFCTVSSKKAKR